MNKHKIKQFLIIYLILYLLCIEMILSYSQYTDVEL